jgi:hypothetical protein
MDLDATARTGTIMPRQLGLLDDPGVTDEERAFADAYLANGFRTGAAYVAAKKLGRLAAEIKPGTARKMGGEWLRKDRVRAYLQQRIGKLADDAELDQAEVIRIARRVAAAGLGELPVRRTLIGKEGVIGDRMVFEPNLSATTGAATLLAKFLGVDSAGDEPQQVTLNIRLPNGKADGADAQDGHG